MTIPCAPPSFLASLHGAREKSVNLVLILCKAAHGVKGLPLSFNLYFYDPEALELAPLPVSQNRPKPDDIIHDTKAGWWVWVFLAGAPFLILVFFIFSL